MLLHVSTCLCGISHFSGVVNDPKAVYPGSSFYTLAIFLETVVLDKGLVVQEAEAALKGCP